MLAHNPIVPYLAAGMNTSHCSKTRLARIKGLMKQALGKTLSKKNYI
jgi:hypothetical protein